MTNAIIDNIITLVKQKFGSVPVQINPLPLSGSNRLYYRVLLKDNSYIATYNQDLLENESFFYLSDFFMKNNLQVPKVINADKEKGIYIQEDLGDETLFSQVEKDMQSNGSISEQTLAYYQQALKDLIQFQFSSGKGLDFNRCYPVPEFDTKAIQWDLNYFKYLFLKVIHVDFNEQKLEDDFQKLILFLSEADNSFFMYRDFQSRNIMIKNKTLYYIDFQGGRKGSCFYDVASLLYDAKANLSEPIRETLRSYYVSEWSKISPVKDNVFLTYFHGFVLLRILQALGAYGYRGIFEQKQHFIQSIPLALQNLAYLLQKSSLKTQFPYLCEILVKLPASSGLQLYLNKKSSSDLTVTITSFSYKQGVPEDVAGNHGGYVFDCRALPNPGKDEQLKFYTGTDEIVKNYMQQFPQVGNFLQHVFMLVDASIDKYMERGFTNLMVNFGCTGGQHRSVYCAEMLATHISSTYKINIKIEHINQQNWVKK
jgi:aminoglycoside/choline kinase family phosphotransferase